ncbi:uncharacterized protein FPRN_02301 [Fusarium proliferatum]|nr:uncharacterized protein FPRN_02301 [Fusarium proliferatum]
MTNDSSNTGAASNGEAKSSFTVKAGLAQMLKGGVIMDVTNAEQARIAEEADGGVARMSEP